MKTLSLILVLSLAFFGCQKEVSYENGPTNLLPTITTSVVTSITNTTAISGGNISSDGGTAITDRGVCWSTSANPVITDNHTTEGTGTGTFASNITGLSASTLYYVRAYATNANGTAYGNEISFTTSATTGALPTVTTSAISAITQTTASGGGDVLTDGGSAVTSRGICWSTSSNPDVTNSHTAGGAGLGTFTCPITTLTAATTYYVRAYATNTNGTAYGNELTFTTAAIPGLPTVTTDPIAYPGSTSAASGGNVISDGGSPVTARGVCWSTTTAPVVTGSHTTNGAGLGTFVSSVSPLTPATTYYVRAYATNANGTAYGNERTFTTPGTSGPDVYVVGYESNGTKYVAKYWKNGIPVILSDGTKDAYADDIFVVGSDVYVCGSEVTGVNTTIAKFWKNGVVTNLSTGAYYSSANSIFVSGTDVYIAGTEAAPPSVNGHAMYWKNGVVVSLPDGGGGSSASSGEAIVVSGTDVYVSGSYYDQAVLKNKSAIWKNSVLTDQPVTAGYNGNGNSLKVIGSDVYSAGFSYKMNDYAANYWKNAVNNILSAPPTGIEARAYGIDVNGTDVYVSGYEYTAAAGGVRRAKYWKNGVAINLSDGTYQASGGYIRIFNGDIYVSGYEKNSAGNGVAKYWKNGITVNLNDGTQDAYAGAIFIQ